MATETRHLTEVLGDIALGAEVQDANGDKLGEVSRVIIDARSQQITDIVVMHGSLLKDEVVVPLRYIADAERNRVALNATKDEFNAMSEYNAAAYRAPDPDYTGPPGDDATSSGFLRSAQMDAVVAFGPYATYGTVTPPGGFPGGEVTAPEREDRPLISEGSDILSNEGEKVGEVAELLVHASDGELARLFVKKGFIFRHEREVPIQWVAEIAAHGVVLNVPKGDVEALFEQGNDADLDDSGTAPPVI